jgi:hypothetical protein
MPIARLKQMAARALRMRLARFQPEFLEAALYRSILRYRFADIFKSRRIEKREAVWDFAADTLGRDRPVLYLEFGVHEGYSIRHFAKALASSQSRFYGFDSFEGLPEDWGSKAAGHFSTDGKTPVSDDPRIAFVKGWFHATLPGFAPPTMPPNATVLAHLDADLYSSTLFVLAQLWARYDSFYAVFDEFSGHETRALYNFRQAFACDIVFLAYDHPMPNRVFCRIDARRV